ncbi:uncharacterized protein BP5553_00294 [Venustampulla echinocandica]|uniref:Uncharacterized protein n=1 Tax=Venustampulla echinocandica TaxID=2656787 RepID=A0A370TXQ5_9HELO|nr:uncharacterized protein BP5553_00294 [Venustampulla echinocandica]RDL40315.1 hypothetical protein BP5553_00294 [Venustampulla echinocandica]
MADEAMDYPMDYPMEEAQVYRQAANDEPATSSDYTVALRDASLEISTQAIVPSELTQSSESSLASGSDSPNSDTTLEEAVFRGLATTDLNTIQIVVSSSSAQYTIVVSYRNFTPGVIQFFAFLRTQCIAYFTALAGDQDGRPHIQSILNVWQELPLFRSCISSLSIMETTVPRGFCSTFAPKLNKRALRLKKGQKGTDARMLRMGFDSRIFARSRRISTKHTPIICPYMLRGARNDWDSFNADSTAWNRRSATCGDLEILHPSHNVAPLSPEFDRLATAFFNGDAVPEDLDTLPNPLPSSGVNYKMVYYASSWTEIINAKLLEDDNMAVFLQDVIMANELEKACVSKTSYGGRKVFRHRSYPRIVESMKDKALNDLLEDDIDAQQVGAGILLPNDTPVEVQDAEQLALELSDLTKSDSTLTAGEPLKVKKRRGKKKRVITTKKPPLHEAMPEKPLEDDANHDEKIISAELSGELNERSFPTEVAQAESLTAMITVSPKNLGSVDSSALFVSQGGLAEDIQLEGGDGGWTTVAPKSHSRSKISRKKASQSSAGNPSGNLDRGVKPHQKRAVNKKNTPSQQPNRASEYPRNRSSSGMPATPSSKAASFRPSPGAHQSTKSRDNISNEGGSSENMRVFDPEQYPAIPAQHRTSSEYLKDSKSDISVAVKTVRDEVTQPKEPSVHSPYQIEDQAEDRHASTVSPKATSPVSKAASPVSKVASPVPETDSPILKAPSESAILSALIKPALGVELGLRETKSDSELPGNSEAGSNDLTSNFEAGGSDPTGDVDDGQQTFSVPPEQPDALNTEAVTSNYMNNDVIATGVEADLLVDRHYDPSYGTTTENGGPIAPGSNLSNVPTPNFNHVHTSGAFPCSLCKMLCIPSLEMPLLLCPGCGFDCNVRYCSVACLLVDAYGHSRNCINSPASQRTHASMVPNTYIYEYNPPFQMDRHPVESPEKFRQRAFSIYCHSGPFPPLMEAWAKSRNSVMDLDSVVVSETRKITGDYHVFRSNATTDGPRYNPVADVIFTIKLRVGDQLKGILNRTLNVCFYIYHPTITRFLFRLLQSLILDSELFEMLPQEEDQATILKEFKQQFSKEFSCDPESYNGLSNFDFDYEWPQIAPILMDVENRYPLICTWMRYRGRGVRWQYVL